MANPVSLEKKSKSALKRDMQALQHLGKSLVDLSSATLKKIPLPESLQQAIEQAQHIKSREAFRRQLQYIGRLMRTVDVAPIQTALDKIQSRNYQAKIQIHQLEKWRDRLIKEGIAIIDQALTTFPKANAKQLEQLIIQAQKEQKQGSPPHASRQLFRYLRDAQQTNSNE